ncbi:unnamed protein product [Allacma fusca]|uniref:Uncharacterized protein n=1 Tax=Allacma fusca TaxID=39272 RepID=A0A8J2PG69_9HEXA|nr:unnamed protein product [Allacma fusca]
MSCGFECIPGLSRENMIEFFRPKYSIFEAILAIMGGIKIALIIFLCVGICSASWHNSSSHLSRGRRGFYPPGFATVSPSTSTSTTTGLPTGSTTFATTTEGASTTPDECACVCT